MPTFSFLFYLLCLGGVYLFRLSYLGWFGPYLLAVFIGVPILLLLLSLPCMLCVQCKLEACSTVTRGDEAELRLVFSHPRLAILGKLRLRLEIENRFTGELTKMRFKTSCLAGDTAIFPLPADQCGLLVCRVTRMDCRDILGLLSFRRKLPEPVSCAVLPAAVPPEQRPDIDAAMQTQAVWKPKYGGGFSEEHDLRPYQQGDTINSIHWKLSSKTDELIVREPLVQVNDQVFVLLSQTGEHDRGLESLYWLSLELCKMEIPHILVGQVQCPVCNEQEAVSGLTELLSAPMGPPVSVDLSRARCVFSVSGGEVRVV